MTKKKKTAVLSQAPAVPSSLVALSSEHFHDTREELKTQDDILEACRLHRDLNAKLSCAYDTLHRWEFKHYDRCISTYRDTSFLVRRSLLTADCGTFLTTANGFDPASGLVSSDAKLFRANFCKDRFCPMCNWRRSLKLFSQVSRMVDVVQADSAFLFLTLTVPNVPGSLLPVTLDNMTAAYSRLLRRKDLSFVRGSIRVTEITRNVDTGDYHPHFHCVLAVPPNYFSNPHFYKKQAFWVSVWSSCYRSDVPLVVDVRKIKGKSVPSGSADFASAVAEVVKYAVKPSDYLSELMPVEKSAEILADLVPALFNRRLFNTTGVFRKVFSELHLSDPESGALSDDDMNTFSKYPFLLLSYHAFVSGGYDFLKSECVVNPDYPKSLEAVI